MNRLAKIGLAICLACCTVSITACSEEERIVFSEATLEGNVLYAGKPVPHALVIVTNGSSSFNTQADAYGKYKLEHAPTGQVQIGVNTEAGRGMMMGQMMAASQGAEGAEKPKFVDLPKKFFEPTTSGLTATITDGKVNTHDIEVK